MLYDQKLQQEKEKKERDRKKSQMDLDQKKHEKDRIDGDIRKEEETKRNSERDFKVGSEEKDRLIHQIQILERELQDAKQKQDREKQAHIQQGRDLNAEFTREQQELTKLEAEYNTERKEYDEVMVEIAKLKNKAQQLHQVLMKSEATLSTLRQKIATDKTRVTSQDRATIYSGTAMASMRHDEVRLQEKKRDLQRVEMTLSVKQHAVIDAENKLRLLQANKAKLEADLRALQRKIQY